MKKNIQNFLDKPRNCTTIISKEITLEFQKLRLWIPKYPSMSVYKDLINFSILPEQFIKGLENEFRAYWYLVKRFKDIEFSISSIYEDSVFKVDINGIHSKTKELITFQVGGSGKRDNFTTDYLVMVSSRCYLYKNSNSLKNLIL